VSIRISAVVCTFNRVGHVRQALRSLVDQTLAARQHEILVVDNGSRDGTVAMIRDEFGSAANLRLLHERRLGVSHARNTAWQAARGQYVAFLDDDAVAAPDWLSRILGVFETVRPQPGAVCGKVDPIWETPPPAWWPKGLLSCLTIIDWSPTPTVLNADQFLAGANMAFPRARLQEVGGFVTSLDRKGSNLLSLGDTYMREMIEHRGHDCYYDPGILVRHHVAAARVTKAWFRRRGFWHGVSDAAQQLHEGAIHPASRRAEALRSTCRLLCSPRQIVRAFRPTDHPARCELKWYAWAEIGRALALWGLVGNEGRIGQ